MWRWQIDRGKNVFGSEATTEFKTETKRKWEFLTPHKPNYRFYLEKKKCLMSISIEVDLDILYIYVEYRYLRFSIGIEYLLCDWANDVCHAN